MRLHPRVETGRTPPGGDGRTRAPYRCGREKARDADVELTASRHRALSVFGFDCAGVHRLASITTEPQPGLSGDGPWVASGSSLLVAGSRMSAAARAGCRPGVRIAWLLITRRREVRADAPASRRARGSSGSTTSMVIVAACGSTACRRIIVSGGRGVARVHRAGFVAEASRREIDWHDRVVVPWFLVMRLVGRTASSSAELRESRAAEAESAALAERGRVARDMHDVLAHSLSALALQLEGNAAAGPRPRRRSRRGRRGGARPPARGGGLTEARDAIAALRGEELPGPSG